MKSWEPTSRRRAVPIAFAGLHASLESSAASLHILHPAFRLRHKARYMRQSWARGTGYFRIDAGTFSLVGPAPLDQERTCVSGQVGPGHELQAPVSCSRNLQLASGLLLVGFRRVPVVGRRCNHGRVLEATKEASHKIQSPCWRPRSWILAG